MQNSLNEFFCFWQACRWSALGVPSSALTEDELNNIDLSQNWRQACQHYQHRAGTDFFFTSFPEGAGS